MPEPSLRDLLQALFDPGELRRFLGGLPGGERLVAALPGALASLEELADSGAELLTRHGEVSELLFTRLVEARPGRLAEIEAVARAYGHQLGEQLRMCALRRGLHGEGHALEDPQRLAEPIQRSHEDASSPSVDEPAEPLAAQAVADLHRRIRELVQTDRVEQAALRLLDLAGPGEPKLLDEAIVLAARVREYYRASRADPGPTPGRDQVLGELLSELLRLAARIADQARVAVEANEPAPDSRAVVLRARRLCLQLRGAHRSGFALRDVSLELRPRTLTGVVGPNGAGKTTLLRIAAGLLRPDSGELEYPALTPGGRAGAIAWHRIKPQIGYVAQRVQPWHGRMIDDLHAWAARHGLSARDNLRVTRFYLERLGLTAYQEARWTELSAGFQVRFELARVLLTRPRLLVLDEPLASLDVLTRERFLRDICDIISGSGQAVLLSSQHIHEIEAVTTDVLCLRHDGRPFELAAPSTWLFELEGELPAAALDTLRRRFGPGSLRDHGGALIVRSSSQLSLPELLALLPGARLRCARDISRSAMRMFRE